MQKSKKSSHKRSGSSIGDLSIHDSSPSEVSKINRKDDMNNVAKADGGSKPVVRFEDPYEDEEEEEEIVNQQDVQMEDDQLEEIDAQPNVKDGDIVMKDGKLMDDEEDEEEQVITQLYQPGVDQLEEGEEMEYDNSAYIMLHRLNMEWPCLSFDFVHDGLGANRTQYPATAFMIAGTQADHARNDKIMVLKLSDLHRTRKDRLDPDASDSESDDSDGEDDLDDDPVVDFRFVKHTGSVNRIRSMPQRPHIASSWSDAGRVYLWDLSSELRSLGMPCGAPKATPGQQTTPIFSFKDHKDEGYALDWSPVKAGRMVSGDCKKTIFLWELREDGHCSVDSQPFVGHSDSVEDLQWSPTEEMVFSSCSVDLSVRIWDIRERKKSMVNIDQAHEQDVNVISWNKKVPFLLASGSDDGSFKVWDLRMLKRGGDKPEPVGFFKWHQAPITSLQWHPHDETVIAAAGADNQVSVWDFGLEEDPEEANLAPKLEAQVLGSDGRKVEIPPQLLFLHQGQQDPKEIRFHPQVPGLIGSTAADGFHAFICEPLDPKCISKKYLANK